MKVCMSGPGHMTNFATTLIRSPAQMSALVLGAVSNGRFQVSIVLTPEVDPVAEWLRSLMSLLMSLLFSGGSRISKEEAQMLKILRNIS